MEHQLGLLVGLAAGLAAGLALVALLLKKRVIDMTFDERQERARGRAFQWGFSTLAVLSVLYGLTDTLVGRWCDTLAGVTLCVLAALVVFAAVCIRNDAYLSLKERPGTVTSLLAVLALVNLAYGGVILAGGRVVEGGVLTFRVCNLAAGAAIAAILLLYIGKRLADRREEAE